MPMFGGPLVLIIIVGVVFYYLGSEQGQCEIVR
jgi:hypothetical protein